MALSRKGKGEEEGRKMWVWGMLTLIQLFCREGQSEYIRSQFDMEMLSRLIVYRMKSSQ